MDQLAEYRARQRQRFLEEKQRIEEIQTSQDQQDAKWQSSCDDLQTSSLCTAGISNIQQRGPSTSAPFSRSQSCSSVRNPAGSFEGSRPASSGSSGYPLGSSEGSRPESVGSVGSSSNTRIRRPRGSATLRAVSAARALRVPTVESVLPGSSWPGHLGDQGPLRSKTRAPATPTRLSTPSTPSRHRSLSCSFQDRTRIPQPWMSNPCENHLQDGLLCH